MNYYSYKKWTRPLRFRGIRKLVASISSILSIYKLYYYKLLYKYNFINRYYFQDYIPNSSVGETLVISDRVVETQHFCGEVEMTYTVSRYVFLEYYYSKRGKVLYTLHDIDSIESHFTSRLKNIGVRANSKESFYVVNDSYLPHFTAITKNDGPTPFTEHNTEVPEVLTKFTMDFTPIKDLRYSYKSSYIPSGNDPYVKEVYDDSCSQLKDALEGIKWSEIINI